MSMKKPAMTQQTTKTEHTQMTILAMLPKQATTLSLVRSMPQPQKCIQASMLLETTWSKVPRQKIPKENNPHKNSTSSESSWYWDKRHSVSRWNVENNCVTKMRETKKSTLSMRTSDQSESSIAWWRRVHGCGTFEIYRCQTHIHANPDPSNFLRNLQTIDSLKALPVSFLWFSLGPALGPGLQEPVYSGPSRSKSESRGLKSDFLMCSLTLRLKWTYKSQIRSFWRWIASTEWGANWSLPPWSHFIPFHVSNLTIATLLCL